MKKIIYILVLMLTMVSCDLRSSAQADGTEGEWKVAEYTTVYEIIYPDSVYRYTCISHLPLELHSSRGTNYLSEDYFTSRHVPEWWKDEWKEPYISTTAPIRVVESKLNYKKVKYRVSGYKKIPLQEY
jgi:hypothetical protein